MDGNAARKLEAIDLIKLYGVIQYQWDLRRDSINWRGPINKLLSPETPLILGSSFNNTLDSNNFWLRMQALTQATVENPKFTVKYNLCLPNYHHCYVEEKGEVLYGSDGTPLGIEGDIRFLDSDHDVPPSRPLSGYDTLTGFSEKEVSLETLISYLEQSQLSGIPGAYIVVTIDQLTLFACQHGLKATENLIKETTEAVRHAIRFNDFMGKTSSCCFGIVLKDCDRWGIIRTADRLISAAQQMNIKTESGQETKVSISLGGIVFPNEQMDAPKIMQRAERYLFEAQSIKGGNVAGTPYSTRTAPDLERPADGHKDGKRRSRDVSKIAEIVPEEVRI